MGVSCSCPFAASLDFENGLESLLAKFDNLGDGSSKALVRCVSFRLKESMQLSEQGLVIGSEDQCLSQDVTMVGAASRSPGSVKKLAARWNHPKHDAAIKLPKVYKSFRTRRKLADSSVLVEQSWWKLLDFAELKHSSISFFEIDKHESAVSRWSRARTRAAKVGKGLSKNCKARKLALQHWLEAIDPRHRYGHNLHFYYVKWLNSQSKEPFFYWLDVGEGKEVNLTEKCTRSKLQQQCIKYLGPMERKAYEVVIEDGKLLYEQTRELLDTIDGPEDSKWIFVLSTCKILYVAKKNKGFFQHSSFLAGGATLAAGRIVAQGGVLKAVWPHSGHYKPTLENFQDFKSFLAENQVDLSNVKLDYSIDDEEEKFDAKEGDTFLRSNSSEDDLTETTIFDTEESSSDQAKVGLSRGFKTQLSTLQTPINDDLLEMLRNGYGTEQDQLSCEPFRIQNNRLCEEIDETKEDAIFLRINGSYQLGKQVCNKWSSGAGPRIGCHALEHANFSPRSKLSARFESRSRPSTQRQQSLSCWNAFGASKGTCSSPKFLKISPFFVLRS